MTHLLFADDLLIFLNGKKKGILKRFWIFALCMRIGIQFINVEKSCFFASEKLPLNRVLSIQHTTRIPRKPLPSVYLGAPLYVGKIGRVGFSDLITKIERRKSKLLSTGGRITLIKHVLSSMPIHIFSVAPIPKYVAAEIERLFSNSFPLEWRG